MFQALKQNEGWYYDDKKAGNPFSYSAFQLSNPSIRYYRKELSLTHGGSSNEAKNERLRVRWLGSAVTELQNELAEMLKARNASEELAERARMRSEIALLRGDIAEVGRGVRDLGGRITRLEAALGTVRVDISATKERASQLSRTCADVSSQVRRQINAQPVTQAATAGAPAKEFFSAAIYAIRLWDYLWPFFFSSISIF